MAAAACVREGGVDGAAAAASEAETAAMEEEEAAAEGAPAESCPWLQSARLLYQGAEAKVYGTQFGGRRAVVKERFEKKYRHASLDRRLTNKRLQGEARSIVKARKLGVRAPALFAVDLVRRCIVMQHIGGKSVKDFLLELNPPPIPPLQNSTGGEGEAERGGEGGEALMSLHAPASGGGGGGRQHHQRQQKQKSDGASSYGQLPPAAIAVAHKVGAAIARIHDGGLIHGDLTTSNILLVPCPLSNASQPSAAPSAASSASPAEAAPASSNASNGAASAPTDGAADVPLDGSGPQPSYQTSDREGSGGAADASTGREALGTANAAGVAANPAAAAAAAAAPAGGGAAAAAGEVEAVLIDFGLSFNSTVPEDKAVDLYVLERALLSLHARHDYMMEAILDSYRRTSKQWSATLNRLAQVRARGRKRVMVG